MIGDHRLATPDLDRIFRGETVSSLSEWQLLERYLEEARRDRLPEGSLVGRGMVRWSWVSAGRNAGRSQPTWTTRFQATFLVLVRRARHLGPSDAIGPWLRWSRRARVAHAVARFLGIGASPPL